MVRLLASLVTIVLASHSAGAAVSSFKLSDDELTLSIQLSDGSSFMAPHTNSEQAGFSNVQIAPNKRLIGWTVTFLNCCTSYPLPRSLVVHDGSRIVRIVGVEDLSIFEWQFSKDSQAIVYFRELPHGNSPRYFRWIRVCDGKVLGEFDCFPDDPDIPSKKLIRPPK